MFGDVLVPLDGSDRSVRALEIAAPICRYLDSTLRVVAFDEMKYLADTNREIMRIVEGLDADGLTIDVRVEVPQKRVSQELLDLMNERPGTLLCMSTHGRGRSELITGSVANEVVRHTTSPVLLVGPHCETERFSVNGRVVVSADGSSVSEAIIPVATAWSIVTHSPVEVISVIDPKAAKIANASHGDISESAYVHRVAMTIGKDLERSVDYEVLHGNEPAKAIVDHVEGEAASIIAMATHGVTGMARITTGSVTSEVIRTSPVPVLVVRPPHFSGQ